MGHEISLFQHFRQCFRNLFVFINNVIVSAIIFRSRSCCVTQLLEIVPEKLTLTTRYWRSLHNTTNVPAPVLMTVQLFISATSPVP